MKQSQARREIMDVLIEKPFMFTLDEKPLFIYHETLGKKLYLRDYIRRLGINDELLSKSPIVEAARVVKEKKKEVCNLIAIYTLERKDEFMNPKTLFDRSEMIRKDTNDDDKVTLLVYCLSQSGKADEYMNALGITADADRKQQVLKVKESNNVFTFGGVTIYGTLLNAGAEKYGWTLDYMLWGISYTNLRLMIADAPSSVILTDKERKQVHVSNDNIVINADDPANQSKIREMLNG